MKNTTDKTYAIGNWKPTINKIVENNNYFPELTQKDRAAFVDALAEQLGPALQKQYDQILANQQIVEKYVEAAVEQVKEAVGASKGIAALVQEVKKLKPDTLLSAIKQEAQKICEHDTKEAQKTRKHATKVGIISAAVPAVMIGAVVVGAAIADTSESPEIPVSPEIHEPDTPVSPETPISPDTPVPDTGNVEIGPNASYILEGSTMTIYGTGEVTSTIPCAGVREVIIEEGITSICDDAFKDCTTLASITIPNSLTSIGTGAFFGCTSIKTATMPAHAIDYIPQDSLTTVVITSGDSIGYGAFEDCSTLTSITISNTVTSIGKNAFSGCYGIIETEGGVSYVDDWAIDCDASATSVQLREGTRGIANYAFENRVNLASIIIPNSVSTIGDCAFMWCGLTSIAIPDSITGIGDMTFYNCIELASITIPNGLTSIGGSAFYNCCSLTNIDIPDSVTSIGDYAFSDCTNLKEVTIGGRLTSIGSGAFSGCTSIETVTMPALAIGYIPQDNLTEVEITNGIIGDRAFSGCTGLTSVAIGDGVTSVAENAFSGCTLIEKATMPALAIGAIPKDSLTTVKITSGDRIGEGAFRDCSTLTSITFPDSLMIIDSSAFYNCTGLTSITIPDSVTSIGDYAFLNCGLTSVTIGKGVTNMGWSVFYGCTGLTSITIPDSVTSIGSYAFNGCKGLTEVYYQGNVSEWLNIKFGSTYANPMYYADKLYISDMPEDGVVGIEAGITHIQEYALKGLQGLTSITIPNSVTSIGIRAFYGCRGLQSVTISDSVENIGIDAFRDCSGLTSLDIPDSVTSIREGAFFDCTGLTNLTIGDGVTSIGNYAFGDCSSLINVTIGNSVTNIGWGAFEGCSGITRITIPDSVTSIDNRAFLGCSGITRITIPDSVTIIGESAFSGCYGIIETEGGVSYVDDWVIGCDASARSVQLREGTRGIAGDGFKLCRGLTSLTILDSVMCIVDGALSGCIGLTSLTVEEGNPIYHSEGNCLIETASKTLIAGCSNSVIPSDGSVTSIGEEAFSFCAGLTSITIPDSVTSIGSNAFDRCTGLTSITLPDNITIIEDFAFDHCSNLTSVTLPKSLTSIDNCAFQSCTSLTDITFQGTMEQWNNISKDTTWNSNTPDYTVTCTDGVLDKSGRQIG